MSMAYSTRSGMEPVNVTRRSTELRNAARKARRDGEPGVASELYKMSALARIAEPNIMRPEYRWMEDQAAQIDNAITMSEYGDGIEPDKDIRPMMSTFFSDIADMRGLSSSARAKEASKYSDYFGTRMDKAAERQRQRVSASMANIQLKSAGDAARIQKLANEQIPSIVDQLRPIVEGNQNATTKMQQIDSLKLRHPEVLADPRVQQLFNASSLNIGEQATMERQLALYATKAGQQKYDDAITRLGVVDKEVTDAVDDFAKGVPEGEYYEKDINLTPELYRKMQYSRVLQLLRETVGLATFSRLTTGEGAITVDVDNISADELSSEFKRLVDLTRQHSTSRRPGTVSRRASRTGISQAWNS